MTHTDLGNLAPAHPHAGESGRVWRAAAMAILTAGALAHAAGADNRPVYTPFVLREGQPDTRSVDTIIASIIRPGMSQRERAFAVYDFVRNHVYHWGSAREYPDRASYDYGVVYDPVKLINVYGYGYCFQNRAAAEALWKAAGLDARSAGIGGHSLAEVYFDGGWRLLDADQHGYVLMPDGQTIASIADIERDPIRLILEQAHPSNPFFPATRDPKVPYESKVILAGLFASQKNNFYQHEKVVMGHRMEIALLPGMRYERRFLGDGRWNIHNGSSETEYRIGYHDPRIGPQCFLGAADYGNGDLWYQPDLTTRSGEYRAGVWDEANVRVAERGLVADNPEKPAWSVFRIRLPYVIVGWPTSFEGPANPRGAAVVSADFWRDTSNSGLGLDVSIDDGRTWTEVWTAPPDAVGPVRALVDLSAQVAYRYEYLVRLRFGDGKTGGDSGLGNLALRTGFQLAPRALPALQDGENRMTFDLGEQTETLEITADLGDSERFLRHVHSYDNIWLENRSIVSRRQQAGEIVYRLAPPKPGTAVRFSVEAGCRREAYALHPDDDIKIYYAENTPENWTLLHDDDFPAYARHWSYHANAEAACAPGTKAVYVKIAMRTAANAAIRHLRLRLHWKPQNATGLPPRGVRVSHAWEENGGTDRLFSTIIAHAPHTYRIQAETNVRNRSVTFEPVRAPHLVWRKNDPPVERPPEPAFTALDPALRDELRRLLRAIDAHPAEGLTQAATSDFKWLADAAGEAQAMMRTRYPLAARTPDPARNPLRDETEREQAARIMAGNNPYAKTRMLGAIPAGEPLPDFILDGLSDRSRHVRRTVLELIRRSPSPNAVPALRKAAREDPLAFIRAEAQAVLEIVSQKQP